MGVLIPRNTTIPTSAKEMFTTSVDGQTVVDLHVFQGERELVKDNRSLARFELRGIDPMPAGLPRIEVTFLIDANGVLQVQAKELRTGKGASIEVKPSYGLTDAEVERMIEESFEHAQTDIRARLLIETRNEADTLIRATEKALVQGKGLIDPTEERQILRALEELRQVRDSEERGIIHEKVAALNEATQHLAELLMDSALKEALIHRKITEIPSR
jgi:molecular chaperone DnaK (HSP70)